MTEEITPSNPTPLHRGGRATAEAGTDDDDARAKEHFERVRRLVQKARR